MKERILRLTKKILRKLPQEHKFKLIDITDSGILNEISYKLRINLISPKENNCCVLILEGNLDELEDKEIIGALVHELAHYLSPKMTEEERRYMLFAELQRNIIRQRKIGGSRLLQPLIRKRDKIVKEIGGLGEIERLTKDYKIEEDATDLKAINWGFEEEITAMRNKSNTFDFFFRFVYLYS